MNTQASVKNVFLILKNRKLFGKDKGWAINVDFFVESLTF